MIDSVGLNVKALQFVNALSVIGDFSEWKKQSHLVWIKVQWPLQGKEEGLVVVVGCKI